MPGWTQIRLDTRGFLFAMATAGFAGILAGLAPALRNTRSDLNVTLKEGARCGLAGPSSHRYRDVLAVTQVALALILLVGAGLMIKGSGRCWKQIEDINRKLC